MTAKIKYLSYDGNPTVNVAPHRPSIEDLGSNTYEDFPGEPVDPIHEWPADCANQMCGVVEQHGKMGDSVDFSVRFDEDGEPFIYKQKQCRTSNVVITALDNGDGDTSCTWPSNSFPPALIEPTAFINVFDGSPPGYATAEAIANGVRVRCYDADGELADLPFTVRHG
jgi:hypothetical protein